MAYQCLDCSYKASKKFPAGKCPACDSFNIRGKKKVQAPVSKKRDSMGKTILMVLLWGVVFYGAWDGKIKYLH